MKPRKRRVRKEAGRNSFEQKIMASLDEAGAKYTYESMKIKYQKPPSNYTPDIILDNGIIVELKGYFDAEDRAKHLLIQTQRPDLDIRFVFYKANTKIHKSSLTTYGSWATKHGFKWADKEIPAEWIGE